MASQPSNYGDDSFQDQRIKETGLLDDIKSLGPGSGQDVYALVEEVINKGKPYDDRTMVMERVMQLTASLPPDSKMRKKLSSTIITTMWDSLQHPPQCYFGDDYQYRKADGSNNNVMIPQLGKAGMPYAKSVRSVKGLHGAKPDPGLLFDMLQARPDGPLKTNAAGINSMLFYHATIIIHDLFRTNRADSRISDTSSYLDLSPLYGKDQAAQDTVRTFKDGKLKPDTFAEERLLGQPPGTCVFLVMWNRMHNYTAENLAAINDNGRFTMPVEGSKGYDDALKKRDYDLFQTSRLVVCGLYMNITLHDYIRGITNVHHSTSTWTIEPRTEINNADGLTKVERGVGNQVSAEFNLLYRFHSAISERDDKWSQYFHKRIFGDVDIAKLSIPEFIAGALKFEAQIPKEPEKREFGGLKRDPTTGCFDDDAMVEILKASIEDPAGAFGARNVPKHLRNVEILGILQARQWRMASLNELRRFFGLKEYDTFEELNPDPEIADILRKLYDSPDMVEMYPGLFIEDIKKRMDPGSGIGIPFTAGRAVLSDAVGFIRGDRFFTVDYSSANLTPWGYAEVQQDYDTLGGSMFHRLIHRSFPTQFKFNSIYCMQPMYLPSMNVEIFKQFKTIDLYSTDPPAKTPKAKVLGTQAAVKTVVSDSKIYGSSYIGKLPDSASADFMICGDCSGDKTSHTKLAAQVKAAGGLGLFQKSIEASMRKVLAREAYKLRDLYQVDMTKDIARVVMIQVHSDFLNLPLATTENAKGLSESAMYGHLENYVNYSLIDSDKAESFRLRRQATASYQALQTATSSVVSTVARSEGFFGHVFGGAAAPPGSLREMGQKFTKDLIHAGYSEAKTATILYSIAAGGVGPIANLFVQLLDYLLKDENKALWDQVCATASQSTSAAYEKLKAYTLEAARFQSVPLTSRVCQGDGCQVSDDSGSSVSVKKGETIFLNNAALNQDPSTYPTPDKFDPSRDSKTYQLFATGTPHDCIGREIAIVSLTSMVKTAALIKGLRRAPGPQGQIKYVPGKAKGEKKWLSDDWSRFQCFAGSWKVHFDELPV